MDSLFELCAPVEVSGLRTELEPRWHVASLRHFAPAGDFAAALSESAAPLPGALQAVRAPWRGATGEFVLAWRGPTETLLLSEEGAAFAALEARLAACTAGCMVDQTGGILVLRVGGERAGELLQRIGSSASIPGVGEARTSRMAELPVTALCLHPGSMLLLVERVYALHLFGWIRTTAADY